MKNPTMQDALKFARRPGAKLMGLRVDWPPAELPLFVSIPIGIKTPNGGWGNQRGKAAQAKRQRSIVQGALYVRYGDRKPKPPLLVTLDRRIPKGGRELDSDNLAFAFKHVRDGVADWLGVNDAERFGVRWVCKQTPDRESRLATVGITIAADDAASRADSP